MFASLCKPFNNSDIQTLLNVVHRFSPDVEVSNEDTVTFSIDSLRRLLGSPHQIAAEIARCGYEQDVHANLAIARNPDSAILLARHFSGVTLVTPGEEQFKLSGLPLECLAQLARGVNPRVFESLQRWGLKTCGELAEIDPQGITERLGPDGVYLRNLAGGWVTRPLLLVPRPASFEAHVELEYPLEVLEPLLFLLASCLRDLCAKLRLQGMGARNLKLCLQLDGGNPHSSVLEFPTPLDDARSLLKLIHLHLECHKPAGPVTGFKLHLEPTLPKRIQAGFFMAPAPLPDRLEVTLARVRALVGSENVITPRLVESYRPDAFTEGTLHSEGTVPDDSDSDEVGEEKTEEATIPSIRFGIRLLRPPLPAKVKVSEMTPRLVKAKHIRGQVVDWAGPWKNSGEWWDGGKWMRVEWDVALSDGGLYRIYQDCASQRWFVHGIYD